LQSPVLCFLERISVIICVIFWKTDSYESEIPKHCCVLVEVEEAPGHMVLAPSVRARRMLVRTFRHSEKFIMISGSWEFSLH